MNHFCLFLLLFTLNTELETKGHFKGLSYNVSEGAALFLPFPTVWPSVLVYAGYAMLYDYVCTLRSFSNF